MNCQIIVIFKNPRETNQINHLARQVCNKNPKFLQEAYEDACEKAYGYLLLDLRQTTPEHLRFRTNIFQDDNPNNIIYVSNSIDIDEANKQSSV